MGGTIIFDFDGVIHSYKSGWQGAAVANDPPVEGIKEQIAAIRKAKYNVVVVSSRCHQEGGIDCIKDYLKKYDIEVDKVTLDKVPALVTVDDRCICFDPNIDLLEAIQNFKTWYGTK